MKTFSLNTVLKVNILINVRKIQASYGQSTKTDLTQKSDQRFQ